MHQKLVRDLIVELKEAEGEIVQSHVADQEEYLIMLRKKLREEVEEFSRTPNEEEMADILEVLRALAGEYKIDLESVEQVRQTKAELKGAFKGRIILHYE